MTTIEDIRSRYRDYVEDYPVNTEMSFESESGTPYPLQSRALGDSTFSGVYLNKLANERDYLFEVDPSAPDIEQIDTSLLAELGTELLGALMVQVTDDHLAFWQRSFELLAEMTSNEEDYNLLPGLYQSTIGLSNEEIIANINLTGIPFDGERIAAYLAYPLIESIGKWYSQEYIEISGRVKPGHVILGLDNRIYGPLEDPDKPDVCSNIGDLLHHIEHVVADDELRRQLEQARAYSARLYDKSAEEVYGGIIASNRHRSVHGETEAPAELGVLQTLTGILICSKYSGH